MKTLKSLLQSLALFALAAFVSLVFALVVAEFLIGGLL